MGDNSYRGLIRSLIANRIFCASLILLSIVIRILLLPQPNADLGIDIDWYQYIIAHGGFHALADNFTNYSPFYTYLLLLATRLSFLPAFIAIKLIPIFFDFIAAYIIFRLVLLKYPTGIAPWLAYFSVLFAPSIFVTSAFWGQTDIIYVTFLLACTYFLLRERPLLGMIFFSLAFAFKFQAVFLSPFLLALIIRRKIHWAMLALPPLVYFLFAIPAWLAGHPLLDLLLVYSRQAAEFQRLSLNAPNPYVWISDQLFSQVFPIGVGAALIIALVYVYLTTHCKTSYTSDRILVETTLILTLMPFVLPTMHERYFFAATLFAIVLAFYQPHYKLVSIGLQASMLISYLPFLRGYPSQIVYLGTILNLVLLTWLASSWFTEIYPRTAAVQIAKKNFADL